MLVNRTDVISRGIDIADINLVVNYDVPGEAADYVHRVGRTARADTTGVAITLISEDGMHDFSKIEELIDTVIHKLEISHTHCMDAFVRGLVSHEVVI